MDNNGSSNRFLDLFVPPIDPQIENKNVVENLGGGLRRSTREKKVSTNSRTKFAIWYGIL